MLGGWRDSLNFDGWCRETRVCIKEQMVLEMPSENRQCQGRGNMGGQLIPDLGCSGWKRFWGGHWCFPQWCRYGYGRGRPEWSWSCVSWKNLSKVKRLLVVQYLESSCGNFEIDSMAYREPVQAGDVAVPRLLSHWSIRPTPIIIKNQILNLPFTSTLIFVTSIYELSKHWRHSDSACIPTAVFFNENEAWSYRIILTIYWKFHFRKSHTRYDHFARLASIGEAASSYFKAHLWPNSIISNLKQGKQLL